LARHGFNYIRVVVFSIAPPVLDSHERDRAKARIDGIVGDKAVSAVRRLECDAEAAFCHDRVKVALNWTPYLADARVCASFAPKVDLPNSVPQSRPTKQIVAEKQALYQLLDFWKQNACNAAKRVEGPWMR
jgi:hypothetical protein